MQTIFQTFPHFYENSSLFPPLPPPPPLFLLKVSNGIHHGDKSDKSRRARGQGQRYPPVGRHKIPSPGFLMSFAAVVATANGNKRTGGEDRNNAALGYASSEVRGQRGGEERGIT